MIREWFQSHSWLTVLSRIGLGLLRAVGRIIGLVWKSVLTVLLIMICSAFLFVVIFSAYVKNTLSDDLPIKLSELTLNQTSTIYYWDAAQQQYAVLDRLSGVSGKSQWVNYEDLNPWFEKATVAIEDQRFYDHYGVDWFRTFGAFYEVFLGDSPDVYGGSTITQQLIKNLTQYKDETVKRKILEIFRALQFEKTYTKEEIIECYLNRVYFGERCNGVQAAALTYFGKDQSELTAAECAAIVGITNNPSGFDPYLHPKANKTRQETILQAMYDQGYLKTEAEYKRAVNQPLVLDSSDEDEESSGSDATSWFVDALIEDVIRDLMKLKSVNYETAETLLFNAGYQIYATIDMGVQDIIDQVYSSWDSLPTGYRKSATQDLQSAIVIMDPKTGNILGLSGGMGKKTLSRCFNRATQMLRSPGSTIKPLSSYSLCLDKGMVMPWTIFDDSDFHQLQGSDWYPDNDDRKNEGAVTLRYALQESINTVAAQMIDMLGPQVAYEHLVNNLGFTHLVDARGEFSDVNYASMALGQLTDGESVREMCQAYTIFCNEGIYTSARTYSRIEDAAGNLVYDNAPETRVVLKETTAYYMTDMLCNAVNRGTGWLSKFGSMQIAGKSGGSSDWHDRWYVAYTPYLLSAVWTGYDIGENMGSSNPSTGMWKQVMQRVHDYLNYEDTSFAVPEDMRRVSICVDTGLLATDACANEIRGDRTMSLYMLPGQMPNSLCEAHIYQEVCKDSMGLMAADCPESCRERHSALDPNHYAGTLCTPEYFADGVYPKKRHYESKPEELAALRETATPYILQELRPCRVHNRDPISGWQIEYPHGYLINPVTGMYYDIENDILIDQYSLWQIDWLTGYLLDPKTGSYVDPYTGLTVVLTEDELAAYARPRYSRPPGYPLGQNPPVEEFPHGEEQLPIEESPPVEDQPPIQDPPVEEIPPSPTATPASPGNLWYGG